VAREVDGEDERRIGEGGGREEINDWMVEGDLISKME